MLLQVATGCQLLAVVVMLLSVVDELSPDDTNASSASHDSGRFLMGSGYRVCSTCGELSGVSRFSSTGEEKGSGG